MTRKEALKIIEYDIVSSEVPIFNDKEHREACKTIEQDLDILEILTKYIDDGFDYEYDSPAVKVIIDKFVSEEDYEKVRWYIATHKKLDL